MRSKLFLSSVLGLMFVLPVAAQQDSQAPTDQASTAAPQPQGTAPTWSVGPIDFAGTLDGYYNFNSNHPLNFFTGSRTNTLYNFNQPANQFSLNYAELSLSHQPDPVGFQFDLGFGNTMNLINPDPSGFDHVVQQAFISFKPMQLHGLQLDFGKFVTTAGAEVIETYPNWNYSRSLLFSWGIPYYHMGLRASMPVGSHVTAGLQLVNGWNNTTDNNSGKTIGANVLVTFPKWNVILDYYGGPENTDTNTGWKHLVDGTVNVTPFDWMSAYVNVAYGQNRNQNNVFANGSLSVWRAVAGAVRVTPFSGWAFTTRAEWFDDPSGFAMLGAAGYSPIPVPNTVREVTLTGEYKFMEGLLWRGEYRYDWSDQAIFTRGTAPCSFPFTPTSCPGDFGLGNHKTQHTLTFAVVAYFGPTR